MKDYKMLVVNNQRIEELGFNSLSKFIDAYSELEAENQELKIRSTVLREVHRKDAADGQLGMEEDHLKIQELEAKLTKIYKRAERDGAIYWPQVREIYEEQRI
jgi:hypothetical protein